MKRPDAPRIVRNVVSKRTDPEFVKSLLAFPVDPSNTVVRQNLSRITSFSWQRNPDETLPELSAERQAVAVQLVMLAGVDNAEGAEFSTNTYFTTDFPRRGCARMSGAGTCIRRPF